MYENRRDEIIIRLDNCIIYSKPHFDMNGYPQLMTDSKFEVFSALSDRGKECTENSPKSGIPLLICSNLHHISDKRGLQFL